MQLFLPVGDKLFWIWAKCSRNTTDITLSYRLSHLPLLLHLLRQPLALPQVHLAINEYLLIKPEALNAINRNDWKKLEF
jgi:hypothetical protein